MLTARTWKPALQEDQLCPYRFCMWTRDISVSLLTPSFAADQDKPPLLTRQARSSNCELGRPFGREPNGSVRLLTNSELEMSAYATANNVFEGPNSNALLRFYDGASWN